MLQLVTVFVSKANGGCGILAPAGNAELSLARRPYRARGAQVRALPRVYLAGLCRLLRKGPELSPLRAATLGDVARTAYDTPWPVCSGATDGRN